MTSGRAAKRCRICIDAPLTAEQIAGVDIALAGVNWPEIAEARLAARKHGLELTESRLRALQVHHAVDWLADHGIERRPEDVRAHLAHRVPEVPEIAALMPSPAGAMSLMGYYGDAIDLGRDAIKLLRAQMEAGELDNDELFKLAALGGRYASSAAQLRQRGTSPLPGDEGYVPPVEPEPAPPPTDVTPDDLLDGFIAGSAPAVGPRAGSVRIREIEGEYRPVVDEGPRDRARYNERADQEGSPRLPV